MVDRTSKHIYENPKTYIASIVVFLVLFIIFVYGALFLALLEISEWIIHKEHLSFFIDLGAFGAVIFSLFILFFWISIAYFISYIVGNIIGYFTNSKKSRLARVVIFFAFFHIFSIPWILWPSLRNKVASLRVRHRQKLKKLVLSQKKKRHKKIYATKSC